MKNEFLVLDSLKQYEPYSALFLRLLTGSFLIHGVLDNILSAARMQEFAAFMQANGFAMSAFLAPLSVWAQFLIGLSLILGLFTRWAGLLLAFNFLVGVVMVHWSQSFREWWPAIVLVGLGLHFATSGAGRISLDAVLRKQK